MFRIGRRTVRKSIRSSFLRRRYAFIRAKRAAKRKQRQLKKSDCHLLCSPCGCFHVTVSGVML